MVTTIGGMPRLTLTSDDFKTFDLTLDGEQRKFWRDGNWHIDNGHGTRLGTRSLHWTSALRRAVEQIEGNGE